MEKKKALLYLAFGVLAISFAAIFVKWSSVSPQLSSFYRTFYGTISLFLVFPFIKNNFAFIKTVNAKYFYYVLLAGVVFGVDLYIWHQSIIYIGAGLGTVIANSQVFFVALISTIFFKEKIGYKFYLIAMLAFIGIAFTSVKENSFSFNPDLVFGAFLAVLAGLTYSIFLAFLKMNRSNFPQVPSIYAWTLTSLFSTLTIASLILINNEIRFDIALEEHLILFALGFFVQALAWIAISKAMTSLNLFHVSMTLLGQPVLACVWGIIFFNESYHKIQIIGLLMTLSMIVLAQYYVAKQNNLKKLSTEDSIND